MRTRMYIAHLYSYDTTKPVCCQSEKCAGAIIPDEGERIANYAVLLLHYFRKYVIIKE